MNGLSRGTADWLDRYEVCIAPRFDPAMTNRTLEFPDSLLPPHYEMFRHNPFLRTLERLLGTASNCDALAEGKSACLAMNPVTSSSLQAKEHAAVKPGEQDMGERTG